MANRNTIVELAIVFNGVFKRLFEVVCGSIFPRFFLLNNISCRRRFHYYLGLFFAANQGHNEKKEGDEQKRETRLRNAPTWFFHKYYLAEDGI